MSRKEEDTLGKIKIAIKIDVYVGDGCNRVIRRKNEALHKDCRIDRIIKFVKGQIFGRECCPLMSPSEASCRLAE